MTFCKGELRKGEQLILQEVEVSISSGQLIVPHGQKIELDFADPAFDLKLKNGSSYTIYIEKRTVSYTPQRSTESFRIHSIPKT